MSVVEMVELKAAMMDVSTDESKVGMLDGGLAVSRV